MKRILTIISGSIGILFSIAFIAVALIEALFLILSIAGSFSSMPQFVFEYGLIFQFSVFLVPSNILDGFGVESETASIIICALAILMLIMGIVYLVWNIKTIIYGSTKNMETYNFRRKRLVKYIVFYFITIILAGLAIYKLISTGIVELLETDILIPNIVISASLLIISILLIIDLARTRKALYVQVGSAEKEQKIEEKPVAVNVEPASTVVVAEPVEASKVEPMVQNPAVQENATVSNVEELIEKPSEPIAEQTAPSDENLAPKSNEEKKIEIESKAVNEINNEIEEKIVEKARLQTLTELTKKEEDDNK